MDEIRTLRTSSPSSQWPLIWLLVTERRMKPMTVRETAMAIDKKQRELGARENLDPERLKDSVREMLVLMEALERKLFIKTLEYEMSCSGLRMRDYLIPLGILHTTAEDLTPNDVGHLVRFFRINVPKAMPAVLRVLDQSPAMAQGREMRSAWLLNAMMQEYV